MLHCQLLRQGKGGGGVWSGSLVIMLFMICHCHFFLDELTIHAVELYSYKS